MQILPETDIAEHFNRLVADQVPGRRGLEAWGALLRAHATLIRRLDTELERETALALADFDVLAQLARAHGELRITELADRALISRSGMTRRLDRRRCRPFDRSCAGPSSRCVETVRRAARRSGSRRSRDRSEKGHRRLHVRLTETGRRMTAARRWAGSRGPIRGPKLRLPLLAPRG